MHNCFVLCAAKYISVINLKRINESRFDFTDGDCSVERKLKETRDEIELGFERNATLRLLAIKGNQGQYSVSKQPRHTQGPSQLNSIRHDITKTGTAQHGQAQRNEDRHSSTRTGTT